MHRCDSFRIRKFVLLFSLLVLVSCLLSYIIYELIKMLDNEVSKHNIHHFCDIMKTTHRKSCALEITPDILYIISCMLCLFIVYIIFQILSEIWRIHKTENVVRPISSETSVGKLNKNVNDELNFDDNDDVVIIFDSR